MTKRAAVLGAVEQELMTILWRIGEASVRQVMAEQTASRAYTSVSTMLRLLEKKGLVRSRREGKNHIYSAVLSQAEYQNSYVQKMVSKVFLGNPKALINSLIASEQVDLEELTSLVDEMNQEARR